MTRARWAAIAATTRRSTAPSLARLVPRGEARYVVLGGAYAERGGNAATEAVIDLLRR